VVFIGDNGLTGGITGSTDFTYDPSINQVMLQPGGTIAIGGTVGPILSSDVSDLLIEFISGVTGPSRGVIHINDTIRVGFTGGTIDIVEFMEIKIGNTPRYIPLFVPTGATFIYYDNTGSIEP
jgi:hypothetical protein